MDGDFGVVRRALAVIVAGPEGSANRLWTRLLVGAGCFGDGSYRQRLDGPEPPNTFRRPDGWSGPVVWFRSFPHAGRWPDVSAMCRAVHGAGYSPRVLVCVREPFAVRGSQLRRGWNHGTVTHQLERLLGSFVGQGYPWRPVVYEALVCRPVPVLNEVLAWCGLARVKGVSEEIRDGNGRHFGETC